MIADILGVLLLLIAFIIGGAGVAGIVKGDVVQGVITIVVGVIVAAGGWVVVFA